MPSEQDRHSGSLSDHASRHEHFEFAGHRAGASSARCGDEQRRAQGRVTRSLAGSAQLAWLQDIWQVHYAMDGGKDHNSPEAMIANIYDKDDEANWLKVSA